MSLKKYFTDWVIAFDAEGRNFEDGRGPQYYEYAIHAVSSAEIIQIAAGPIAIDCEDIPSCAAHNADLILAAPSQDQIIRMAKSILVGKPLYHYGSWDRLYLQSAIDPKFGSFDLMKWVAPFTTDFDHQRNNWPYPKLCDAAAMAGIDFPHPGPHCAISDSYVTARLTQIFLNAPKNKLQFLSERGVDM